MNEYRRTSTTLSLLNYHFVFCPRYRRKIFLQADVEQRFKELVHEGCEELQIVIVALECDKDHTHMFLNALPSLSPADMMAKMKGVVSTSSAFAEFVDTLILRFYRRKCIK